MLLLATVPRFAAAHGAHIHGAATLDLALDGSRLELRFTAPGASLVGFERAPRDDAERAALADAKATLATPARWFPLPPAARCELVENTVDDAAFAPGDARAGAHADVRVELAWQCEAPQALDAVDVGAFARFPSLKTITVNLVLPDRQDARTLTPRATRLRLTP